MALSLLAANNAQTVLAAGISSTATSLTVNAGTGTLFPSPVAGTSFFKLTIIDAATGSLTEIVHVTARAGDVFTIQRGQEGTIPRSWSANDIAANMMTAGTLSYILGNFQPLDPTLTALAELVGVANKLPYFNGNDTATLTDLTQVGRDIIGKSTIADILTYLGLDTALNNKQPKSATLTALARLSGVGNTLPYFNGVDYADLTEFTSIGRSIVGQASVAGVVDYLGLKDALNALIKTNNLSDLQNVVTSRSNLGVPKGVDKQMCAAWASFGYRNGSVVIDDGFNISSITRVRLGGYKVVFLTPLNSAKYSVSGSALFGSAGSVVFSPCSDDGADARTTTSFELSISDASDNSFKDSNFINFQVFGGV